MGVKKKDIERDYREFINLWLPKVVERGTLILLSLKDQTEIKEEDLEVLKFFYRCYYDGHLPEFVQNNPAQGQTCQSVTQPNLFNEEKSDVTVHPPLLEFGIGIEDLPVETKKVKKK